MQGPQGIINERIYSSHGGQTKGCLDKTLLWCKYPIFFVVSHQSFFLFHTVTTPSSNDELLSEVNPQSWPQTHIICMFFSRHYQKRSWLFSGFPHISRFAFVMWTISVAFEHAEDIGEVPQCMEIMSTGFNLRSSSKVLPSFLQCWLLFFAGAQQVENQTRTQSLSHTHVTSHTRCSVRRHCQNISQGDADPSEPVESEWNKRRWSEGCSF